MNRDNKYRFKTKVEFETDYGCFWRSRVLYSFPEHMDFLLGTDYHKELTDFEYENNFIDGQNGFSICRQMLVKKFNVPNYRPRKFTRDE